MIELPENYMLLKSGDGEKENVRNAYDMACELAGFSDKETAYEMFYRTGLFLTEYLSQLREIEREFLEETGFLGGVIIPDWNDWNKNLKLDEAAKYMNISFALLEAEIIWQDFMKLFCAFSAKKKGE